MNEQTRNEIIRRHQGGSSIRAIARDLRIARKTVGRVLTRHQEARAGGPRHPDLPTPSRRRASLLDRHDQTIRELLQRYPDITAVRMWEELRTRGFRGSYTILKGRLRELRPRLSPLPVVRFETAPGTQAQMDYAVYDLDFTVEGRRRVYLFSYVLGYSRRQYLRFVESQDFATTMREHIRAFEHLGGVAATCLYDNMKVVVSGYDGEDPIYNPRFLAFATHYGFRPVACRPGRPQTKGKIEKLFQFVQSSLLNGRTFRSLEQLNEVTTWWLAHVADVRIHRQTKKSILERYAEERPHLLPLPAKPYDTAEVVYRTVSVEGFVSYRQNLYSVPWRQIGHALPVRVTEEELIVYGPHIEEIARHPLFRGATGQRSEHKEHRPQDDRRCRHAILQDRFGELGPAGTQFLTGLVQQHRCGKDQAHKVLALLEIYRRDDLVAAMERAVRFRAFSLKALERILTVQAKPKPPLEALADEGREHLRPLLEDAPLPPRPTGEYQPLLFQESPADADPPAERTKPASGSP